MKGIWGGYIKIRGMEKGKEREVEGERGLGREGERGRMVGRVRGERESGRGRGE